MIVYLLISNYDIGDVSEQHPSLVWALSGIVISMLFAEGLLLMILRIVGFGPLGPMKGMVLYSCNTINIHDVFRRNCCVVARVVIWARRAKGWLVCDASAPRHDRRKAAVKLVRGSIEI